MNEDELIAKFLGWKLCECGTPRVPHYKFGEKNWEVVEVKDMKFSTSLDWLKPVLKKIEELGLCMNLNYNPDTKVKYFSIYDSEYRNTAKGKQFYAEGENCMYEAICKFAKWYNTLKTTSTKPIRNED